MRAFGLCFKKKCAGRQTADAPPHHDEIIDIVVGLLHGPPIAPTRERELVGDLERPDVASPKTL